MLAPPNDSIIVAAFVASLRLKPTIFTASFMRATISSFLALYQGVNGAGAGSGAGLCADLDRAFSSGTVVGG